LFANEFCIKTQEPFCTSGHLSKGHCYIGQYNSMLSSHNQYFKNPYVGGYAPADYCPISFDNLYDKSDYYFPTNCKYGKTSMTHPDYGEKVGNIIITGNALADQPNPELYLLNGRMHLIFSNMNNHGQQETHDIPLDAKQLLLKGACVC